MAVSAAAVGRSDWTPVDLPPVPTSRDGNWVAATTAQHPGRTPTGDVDRLHVKRYMINDR